MSEEPGEEEPSFEDRLRAARSRQGLDTPPVISGQGSGDLGGMSPWGIGMRVGIELVSALVVAVAIGYGLDRLLGTKPILTAVFVLLGGAAGILNVWRLFAPRPTTQEPTTRDQATKQNRGR
jgi:ATP synthase protein I